MMASIIPTGEIRLNGAPMPDRMREHSETLLSDYEDSGLAPPHLRTEIAKGCEGETQKFHACLWEAMLYRHFRHLGFEFRRDRVTRSGQNGPDLGLIRKDKTIWIEATVPMPEGIPPNWLSPFPGSVQKMPDEEIVLRWTAALREKNNKRVTLLQKKRIRPEDAYVVAVNSCMLSDFPDLDHGVSQFPFAVEAAFPIGPIQVPFTKTQTGAVHAGPARHSLRYFIKNPKGIDVRTDNFLNPDYAGIGMLIGCSRAHMLDAKLPLIGAYNPLAHNPVAVGVLGIGTEYVAEKRSEEEYELRTIADPPGLAGD